MNRYHFATTNGSESRTFRPANPVMSASPPTTIADASKRCSIATPPEFLGEICRNSLATGRTRTSGSAAGPIKEGLAQRQRSRRRWWLANPGRVSETLRGKRSRGFKAAIITPIGASMRISAHRKRLPAYWLSRPDIYRGAFWSRLQAMARFSVLFKPQVIRSLRSISSIMV